MTRPAAILAAVLVLGLVAIAQATSATRPTTSWTTSTPLGEIDAINAETSCDTLQLRYSQEHSAWKAGVRAGQDHQVEPNLTLMRVILHRLGRLADEGRCGG